jgi:hypothetical protein
MPVQASAEKKPDDFSMWKIQIHFDIVLLFYNRNTVAGNFLKKSIQEIERVKIKYFF